MSTCRTTNPMAVGGPMFCQMEQDHLGRHGHVDGHNVLHSWGPSPLEQERDRFREALERIRDNRRPRGGMRPVGESLSTTVNRLRRIAADALEPNVAVKDTARTVYGGPARSTGPNAPTAHG